MKRRETRGPNVTQAYAVSHIPRSSHTGVRLAPPPEAVKRSSPSRSCRGPSASRFPPRDRPNEQQKLVARPDDPPVAGADRTCALLRSSSTPGRWPATRSCKQPEIPRGSRSVDRESYRCRRPCSEDRRRRVAERISDSPLIEVTAKAESRAVLCRRNGRGWASPTGMRG
jgi:hypothetical protein